MAECKGQTKTGRYEDYRGKKKWVVEHCDHGKATVFAPDEDAAIVAASSAFGVQWTQLEFYSGCKVSKL